MTTDIDFRPADSCFGCLVPHEQTPADEEWCFDAQGRPLCGQCARDEQIIHEPWTGAPEAARVEWDLMHDLSYFLH